MSSPRISVVVAFFNNEDDLGDCLDSIAAQSFGDLEVIMVDDASTDHSVEIARAKAAADPRFILVQAEHGGPGGARNRGVERARGEYLAFVDGDDMLPRQCVRAAAAHAGAVRVRLRQRGGLAGRPQGPEPVGAALAGDQGHGRPGRTSPRPRGCSTTCRCGTSCSGARSGTVNGLSYPEGVVWEDIRLMTKAHVLARAVDVIPDIVYYWRERAQGRLSITQSRTDIGNLRDRMTALDDIDAFIAAHSTSALLRAHQRKALKNDLWLYVQDLHKVTEEYRAEFAELVNGYLDNVGRRVTAQPARHPQAGLLPGADRGDGRSWPSWPPG